MHKTIYIYKNLYNSKIHLLLKSLRTWKTFSHLYLVSDIQIHVIIFASFTSFHYMSITSTTHSNMCSSNRVKNIIHIVFLKKVSLYPTQPHGHRRYCFQFYLYNTEEIVNWKEVYFLVWISTNVVTESE